MTEINLTKYFNAYAFRDFLIQSGALYFLLAFVITFAVVYSFVYLLPIGGNNANKKKKYATLIGFISGLIATYNLGNITETPLSLAYIGFASYATYIIIAAMFLLTVVASIRREQNAEKAKLPPGFFIILGLIIAYLFVTFFPTQTQVGITMISQSTGIDLSWLVPWISVLSPFLIMIGIVYWIIYTPKQSQQSNKTKLSDIVKDIIGIEESSSNGSGNKGKDKNKQGNQ